MSLILNVEEVPEIPIQEIPEIPIHTYALEQSSVSDHDLRIKKYDDHWESCCGIILDRRATVFFSQLVIASVVIIFCIYQLINSITCEADSLYSGMLTLIIGIYLPSPSLSS
tara:strand:+ start:3785 stop:4120 length:336 start_codon:yes stop_codon:yes gene_type:complete